MMTSILSFINETKEFFIQNGALGLFILAFAEASFFPIPPDIVLIPLSIMSPRRAIYYSSMTSLASTLGGVFGYIIGARAGRPILFKIIKKYNLSKIEHIFKEHGGWAVAIAGFTPLPYKVFTIASGVFRVKFTIFFIASLLSRSARFLIEGIIVMALGERAEIYINRLLGPWSFIIVAIALALYMILKKTRIRMPELKNMWFSPFVLKLKELASRYGEFGIYLMAGISCASILGIVFLKMASELQEKELAWFDFRVKHLILSFKSPFFDSAMNKICSFYVFGVLFFILLLLIPFYFRNKRYILMGAINVIGGFIIQWGLKLSYQRPRELSFVPLINFLVYSFPSGLILIFTALSGYVLFLFGRKNTIARKSLTICIWFFCITILGASRIYMDISYPSDIVAGFLIGSVWLISCIVATKALEYYH